MKITKATARYEDWLGKQLRLIPADLTAKHKQMRTAVFPFFRATYYRWAQIWPEICKEYTKAPKVLAIGDLHVENFGTWRDGEGRLIWGINDFDEVWRLPYTNDLIRLSASALLAQMNCEPKAAVDAILRGYTSSLEEGGRPFTLAEHHRALREMATARLHEPHKFWERLFSLPEADSPPPAPARKAIERMMPDRELEWKVVHRVAGLGSLGRQRFVALAEWRGGAVAREAKALAPSACIWAEGGNASRAKILYEKAIEGAVRCRDPFVRVQKGWVVRRLAPDCSRIELSALPAQRDETRLLEAMGWETANVHLGSVAARVLAADLKKRARGWLYRAAAAMEKAMKSEFEENRKSPDTDGKAKR